MWAKTPEQVLKSRRLRELAVLFALFVVPGLVSSATVTQVVGSLSALMALSLRNIAFALLIHYLLDLHAEQHLLGPSGTARPGTTAVLTWVVLLGASFTVSALAALVNLSSPEAGSRAVIASLQASAPPAVWAPVLILAMGSVGYVEELFFRGYLVGRFRQVGATPVQAVLVSAVMFSLGHGYQGPAALVFSFIAGGLLGLLWLRRGHLAAFAGGHTVYNLTALVLAGGSVG